MASTFIVTRTLVLPPYCFIPHARQHYIHATHAKRHPFRENRRKAKMLSVLGKSNMKCIFVPANFPEWCVCVCVRVYMLFFFVSHSSRSRSGRGREEQEWERKRGSPYKRQRAYKRQHAYITASRQTRTRMHAHARTHTHTRAHLHISVRVCFLQVTSPQHLKEHGNLTFIHPDIRPYSQCCRSGTWEIGQSSFERAMFECIALNSP